MDQDKAIDALLEIVTDLKDEEGMSRLLIDQLAIIEHTLNEPIDVELRSDKVRSVLDELDQNQTIPAHIRAQLWNLNAMLEFL